MNIDQVCSQFVLSATKGRDESHGYSHMWSVNNNAVYIFTEEVPATIRIKREFDLVRISAWIHDVADHKYNTPISVVEEFLETNFPELKSDVLEIIESISYSKEVKHGINIKPELLRARNCVSDADKLEALGVVGYYRCIDYTMEKNPSMTTSELIAEVQKHADEKLLRLKDHFIRTATGKRLAEPLHAELVKILKPDSIQ
jgi:HD superfamily phosphodiesterase